MKKLSVIDYLDEDLAYLIGLTFARGEFLRHNGDYDLIIRLPYRDLEVTYPDGTEVRVDASISSSIWRRILGRVNDIIERFPHYMSHPGEEVIKFTIDRKNLFVRNLEQLVGINRDYRNFRIPEPIFKAPESVVKEFLRGFADVAGEIRASNYYIDRDYHRIYLTVLNDNWFLPIDLCKLCQEKLGIPIQTIDWGHPNIRAPKGGQWKKEHQIKIFANEFERIGFYIEHKQEALTQLADITKKHVTKFGKTHVICNPKRRIRETPKPVRPEDENDSGLPAEIRGKHYDHFTQICGDLGCHTAVEIWKQRGKLARLPSN